MDGTKETSENPLIKIQAEMFQISWEQMGIDQNGDKPTPNLHYLTKDPFWGSKRFKYYI